jgi:hypothetical protein
MWGSDQVTYAILIKGFLMFYTQIRYALPRLFHMWKPALATQPPPGFTQRFHADNPCLMGVPGIVCEPR